MLVHFNISKALLCTGFESGGAVLGAFSTRIDPGTSLAPTSTPFTSNIITLRIRNSTLIVSANQYFSFDWKFVLHFGGPLKSESILYSSNIGDLSPSSLTQLCVPLSWANKAPQRVDCSLGCYSSLVALITIVLSDTIKCQPWSFLSDLNSSRQPPG